MKPNNETRFLGTISASSIRNFLPKSMMNNNKQRKSGIVRTSSRSDAENTPPTDPNVVVDQLRLVKAVSKSEIADQSCPEKADSKAEVRSEVAAVPVDLDPSVKVLVRIRPVNDHEKEGLGTVRKVSSDSLCVGDRNFTFDSVLDTKSTQEDVFHLVGVPSVKNALAGYNTSILLYGQTGSGKTFTMWGPPSAMVEDPSPSSHQGIVPRIFQTLFAEIQREQENLDGKQTSYQCRCSFLEVYNEKIGDLLDPTQRNLQIRDDAKNGFYVENLTEEYVTSYEDVTQILIKGLSSRKVGATSTNSKSSRSHIVFTCIIDSWCEGMSSKCFSSSRTSRISFVDLAGMETRKVDDSSRQCLREGKSVKKSLSQLGYLVNILSKETQSGEIPYRSSCLTHLLRESLGGNAKLTVICAITPDTSSNGETLSTLRFGERAKCLRNKPVINEITEDDVNDLGDQIRQLKEELKRAKSNGNQATGTNNGYFQGRNVRDSLNLLRVSINRSLILPRIEDNHEGYMNIDEDEVKALCTQLENSHCSQELDGSKEDSIYFPCCEESFETDLASENFISCADDCEIEEISSNTESSRVANHVSRSSLSISCPPGSAFQEPVMSESPKFLEPILSESSKFKKVDAKIRSMAMSSSFSASRNNDTLRQSLKQSEHTVSCPPGSAFQEPVMSESPKFLEPILSESSKFTKAEAKIRSMAMSSSFSASRNNDTLRQSLKRSEHNISSMRSSKVWASGPTESLAASLQRGLQIIDYHQRNSMSEKSLGSFSFEHLALKPCPEIDEAHSSSFVCASCQRSTSNGSNEEGGGNEFVLKQEELEILCKEQALKIEQLTSLVDQYKQGKETTNTAEYNSESHEPKSSFNGGGNKFSNETIKEDCEIKEVQEVLNQDNKKASFDLNEKEELLKEIERLRNNVQSVTDSSSINKSVGRLRSSLLLTTRSLQIRKSGVLESGEASEELEMERQRWMEMESDWISLTDELRIDLESYRKRAEKVEMELKLEKSCTEELNDVLERSVMGQARMIEHYAELQEKHNDLLQKHKMIMVGIAEVKKAAAKAGAKGKGSRFAKYMAAELSTSRVQKEKEREFLKKENQSLKIQLRETAEAVHAAGEILVRLREAEESASASEANFMNAAQENEKLKKQMEKIKRKHKMELDTMKQYLAESRLPESALRPSYQDESNTRDIKNNSYVDDYDDQAWREEFSPVYQNHN